LINYLFGMGVRWNYITYTNYKDNKYIKYYKERRMGMTTRVIVSDIAQKYNTYKRQKRNKLLNINVDEATEKLCKIIGI